MSFYLVFKAGLLLSALACGVVVWGACDQAEDPYDGECFEAIRQREE